MTTLFDSFDRVRTGPASHIEPIFPYLNQSARRDVQQIRELLEGYFSRYPGERNLELRSRFRSTDDSQYQAAVFELILHEMLLALGCRVTLLGTDKPNPDFLVAAADCRSFSSRRP